MVKLSAKYLIQKNKYNKNFLVRKKNDTDEEFLLRIIHLPLQNQFIDKITKMENCTNIKMLYLQNNMLSIINYMENFPNLTHLYLQRNFILKIENLKPLQKLRKIYLGHNEIQVLEGMEDLKEIKEIHLENQDLPPGSTMYFEPLTIKNLGETLEVLNISNNYLTSIRGLEYLKNLKVLIASDNYLMDLEEIVNSIFNWNRLQNLNLIGNEITKYRWYRDSIILASKNLEILDELPIHPNTRAYVEKLTELKRVQQFKAPKNSLEGGKSQMSEKSKSLIFAGENKSKEIFFGFVDPFSTQKSNFVYLPWKLRSNVNPTNSNKYLPRPYWKKKLVELPK